MCSLAAVVFIIIFYLPAPCTNDTKAKQYRTLHINYLF